MRTYVKKDGKLNLIGEGRLFSKNELMLREDIDANLGSADSIQQAQLKAKKQMNQNAGVTSASIEAGKADGQADTQSGEGIKLEVPVNATGKQLAQAQKMTKDQGSDDAQITFTKEDPNSTNESRIYEMRMNSIPFTKKELSSLLKGE